jgi:hypothetical protein
MSLAVVLGAGAPEAVAAGRAGADQISPSRAA